MALGTTQPPIQCVPGALSLGVKRPGREADHSPPFSAEVKERVELCSTPPIRLHGKHRDNFTFTFYQGNMAVAVLFKFLLLIGWLKNGNTLALGQQCVMYLRLCSTSTVGSNMY
jgi:hypothetical protein